MQKTALRLVTACLTSTFCAGTLCGVTAAPLPEERPQTLPAIAPLPYVRPNAPAVPASLSAPPAIVSPEITGAIPRPGRPGDAAALAAGLDALMAGDALKALGRRDAMPAASLDRRILTWAIALSGLKEVPASEIAAARREFAGWPGLGTLRANAERAIYRENPSAGVVLAEFGAGRPETPQGSIMLAQALAATGKASEAKRLIGTLWSSQDLDKALEDRILAQFSTLLSPADHKARMDYLLYRGQVAQARRFGDLGGVAALHKAWAAVAQRAANAGALLDAAQPAAKADPALLFARIANLRRQEKYVEAAALLAQAPQDKARLIAPAAWWAEERIIARGLADRGQFRLAYQLTANHHAASAVDIADAEFHAGWYALQALGDTAAAARHFEALLKNSNRPLSASRANYWLGRAAEMDGPGNARDYFRKAAAYPGTFYGQLAAARIGETALNLRAPIPTDADRQRFAGRDSLRIIERLEAAGHGRRADILYRALADEIDSPGELALLAARAERNDNHHISLQIGKTALGRGIDVAALAYPIGVIPGTANISGAGKALAYAIARQESAFNPAAVSSADARGLLQLLPGTAKGVAGRMGLAFTPARLTSDAGYNATLGAQYLGEQIGSFGGSYILTFIAYNAGPKRVPEWIARYGDPRGQPIDAVVDWIERIPFPETRNYVQRVMENYQVYKTRLGQKADIVSDLRHGR